MTPASRFVTKKQFNGLNLPNESQTREHLLFSICSCKKRVRVVENYAKWKHLLTS